MRWLVVAPVEGVGPTRIVNSESWKGWPKVKSPTGQILEGEKLSGKTRYHIVGESPDGKNIPQEVKQPKVRERQIAAPPEVTEIVARKAQLEERPEPIEENPNAVEVTAPVESPVATEPAQAKNKGGRPKKGAK